MASNETKPLSVDEKEIGLTPKRWVILLFVFLLSGSSMFSSVCFGLVDDVFTAYFDITYQEADWITLAVYATPLVVVPVLTWLSFANRLGIRRLIIAEAVSVTITYLCIVVAVAYPTLYCFIIVGQIIHGVGNIIQWSIPPIFAVLWFPNKEVGIGIAANFVGAAVGATLGFIVPPGVLRKPPKNLVEGLKAGFHNNTYGNNNFTVRVEAVSKDSWRSWDRDILLTIFITMLVISTLLTIFFIIFLTDVPVKAPTIAQALKRVNKRPPLLLNCKNFKQFLTLIKNMFCDRTYFILVLVYSIVQRAVMVEFTLMGDIIRAISDSFGLHVSGDALAGYVLVFYPMFAATGSITAGFLLTKHTANKTHVAVGAGITFLFTLGLAISHHFKCFPALCVCNAGFGFSTKICIIAMLAVVTRHTYPIDESFVVLWMTGFESIILIIITEVGRLLIIYANETSVLEFMASFVFISFVLVLMIKPRDKRAEIENATTLDRH